MELGQRIKLKRKKDRLSAEDLALKLGFKKENIYKWERGAIPSNPMEFQKLEAWLNNLELNTKNEDSPTLPVGQDGDLTMQALVNLTESNRLQSESLKSMARSHEKLVLMLENKNQFSSADEQRTQVEMIGTVLGMRSLLEEIAVKVTKQPLVEVRKDLGRKVTAAMKKIEHRDSVPAEGM